MILVNLMMVVGSNFGIALMALIVDLVLWGINRNVEALCPCDNATAPGTAVVLLMVYQCCNNRRP